MALTPANKGATRSDANYAKKNLARLSTNLRQFKDQQRLVPVN
jgi:hypothetical protein